MNSAPDPLRKAVPEALADIIGDRIMTGQVRPGEPLREAALAEEFNVSRNTVREALLRLSHERLATKRAHRGSRVALPDRHDLAEIMSLRRAVEPGAVWQLSQARPDLSNVRELARSMEKAAAARDWERYGRLDLDYHTALISATGSRRLTQLFARTVRELRLYLLAVDTTSPETGVPGHVAEHGMLIDAIEAQESVRSLELIDRHLAEAEAALFNEGDAE